MTDTTDPHAVLARIRSFASDCPCIYCGSPALERNSRDQIICMGCLNENPDNARSKLICEAADALTAALREALSAADGVCVTSDWEYVRAAILALIDAPAPDTVQQAATVLLDAMNSGEVWRYAVNAALPVLQADMDPFAWNDVCEVRDAIKAALRALAGGGS